MAGGVALQLVEQHNMYTVGCMGWYIYSNGSYLAAAIGNGLQH